LQSRSKLHRFLNSRPAAIGVAGKTTGYTQMNRTQKNRNSCARALWLSKYYVTKGRGISITSQDSSLVQPSGKRRAIRRHADFARGAFDDRAIFLERLIASEGASNSGFLLRGKEVRPEPKQSIKLTGFFFPHSLDFVRFEVLYAPGLGPVDLLAPHAAVDPASD
jgi:hypothetical protein